MTRLLGAWLALPVEHGTLELKVVSLRPMLGVEFTLKKYQMSRGRHQIH